MKQHLSASNEDGEQEHFYISLFGAIPFAILLFAFIILLFRRKIEDYYLKWTMLIFIVATSLRILMSTILAAIYAG